MHKTGDTPFAMVRQVTKLCDFGSGEGADAVCSVAWSQRGTYLSVGTHSGEAQIWDVSKIKMCAFSCNQRVPSKHPGATSCTFQHLYKTCVDLSWWSSSMGLRRLRTMAGHRARVGVMAWSSHMLSSGSRDRNILQRDIRAPEDFQSKLLGHRSEVHARISWSSCCFQAWNVMC